MRLAAATADLDGSGESETIALYECGNGDCRRYKITVGRAAAVGTFLGVDGDKPTLEIVDVDEEVKGREVMIKAPGASDCSYSLYTYSSARLISSGVLDSDNCTYEPVITGHGRILMSSWSGFWERREVFDLDTRTHRVVRRPQRYYSVGVRGVAKRSIRVCSDPKCSQFLAVGRAAPVDVLLYDVVANRYIVMTEERLIGLVTQRELEQAFELPWAD